VGLEARTNEKNPNPRIACALLLDTSWSMGQASAGGVRPIDELNSGFSMFCDEIKSDDTARKRAEIAVITFGGVARVAIDFTEGRDLQPQTFVADGGTPMGAAVNIALDEIARQKQTYKDAGLLYYRPWLFVISDGAPTDQATFDQAAQRAREVEAAKGISVFSVGVGDGADMTQMEKLSALRPPLRLKGLSFRELFSWLSGSMERVSQSRPPNPTSPGTPTGGNTGEQLALAPVDAWAQVPL
jgi:uncharacterized protein YegL